VVEVWLPYGKSDVSVKVRDEDLLGTVQMNESMGSVNPQADIERAVRSPVSGKRLSETVHSDDTVVIVVGMSEPKVIVTVLWSVLKELRLAGVKDSNVTVLVGSKAGASTNRDEIFSSVTEDYREVKTVLHDHLARDAVLLGETNSGIAVYVNKAFAESRVRLLVGEISVDCLTGYTGGPETLLQGAAGIQTVRQCYAKIVDSNSKVGVTEQNPVFEDMRRIAEVARVDCAVDAVLNSRRELVAAFAGGLDDVFPQGARLIDEMCKVKIDRKAELAVVSAGGVPYDTDLYGAYRAIHTALDLVKKDGSLVFVAECAGGFGNRIFYEWMTRFRDTKEMESEIKKNFEIGAEVAYFLSKALEYSRIYLVSVMPDYYANGVFRMRTARTVNAALQLAIRAVGKDSKISVVPHGSNIVPIVPRHPLT
jgi:nickel-dependent lactate racemase